MIELCLTLRSSQEPAIAKALEEFLTDLVRGTELGFFAGRDYKKNDSVAAAELSQVDGKLLLIVELSAAACANRALLESIFLSEMQNLGCPSTFASIEFRPEGSESVASAGDPQLLIDELARAGKLITSPILDPRRPFSVWIEGRTMADTVRRERVAERLALFERLLADAPFLGCPDAGYAGIGQTQFNWTGDGQVQYWIEAIATHAEWMAILANLLLRSPTEIEIERVILEQ
jgi:hypothetical protein